MNKERKLNLIHETGIIAIMRAHSSEQLITATEAIMEGGVRVLEVTMTTPGALQVIEEARRVFDEDALFGAGTVLDAESARLAILAGAEFIVAPTINLGVISLCRRYSIPIIPGCYSPTELLTAWEAGADMLKLFPASLGGPSFLKAILAPLPQLRIVPVGGVDLNTASKFMASGAAALGVGSSLINQAILDAGDMDELSQRATAFIEQVKIGRGK